MAAIKDNSGISLRDRHKRPDKQLYVPRALRKVRIENTSEIKKQDCDINSVNSDLEREEVFVKGAQSSYSNEEALEKCDELKTYPNYAVKSVVKDVVSRHVNVSDLDSIQVESTVMEYEELDKCIGVSKMEEKMLKDVKTPIHCPEIVLPQDLSEMTSKREQQPKPNLDVCAKEKCCVENFCKLQQTSQIVSDKESSSVCSQIDNNEFIDKYTCSKKQGDRMINSDIQAEASVEEDSWENMFNDDGECLDPKLIKELTDITGRMELTVAKNDYSDYKVESCSVSEEYNNIVELYGFPVEFNTQDLTSAFSMFQKASYTIKWVDDCHALAIFSSPIIANQALHLNHPFVKVRPLSEGIKESKIKARLCEHLSEPPKPRPATSAVLARRLVTGALGLKVHTSKEQRDIERSMLKDAKEKKKLKAKQRQDIWNGIV